MKLLIAVMMLFAGHPLSAQASTEIEALLDRARKSTDQYSDRKFAIAAGYRRAGRDMPSMGEHWINPRILMNGGLDAAKPAVLTYLMIGDRPVLTGVVYAVSLEPGQPPPSAFGTNAHWHEHNGAIDDEALLPEHSTAPSSADGTRVAFLHVWLRIPAPGGIFAAENWAIPFVRAELKVPDEFTNGAARAVSLLGGGIAFYRDLVGSAAAPLISPALLECEQFASSIVAAARSRGGTMTDLELRQLGDKWSETVHAVSQLAGSEAARMINGGIAAHEH